MHMPVAETFGFLPSTDTLGTRSALGGGKS
ncbi:hypothetical protein BESB_013450 [Besnoitia besnoiti]|uniref:Uncharacterized protein n=1 Tax=Besnoitia besnoiti TaxID=94643 RepID=A0A2A9MAL3_BESBE|nr:hypothetical protein BESB_013450 [Besnoitia besnoiti]PFH32733.1 hypothetical protein BESB_013450 [Besnoitia besnoiti]